MKQFIYVVLLHVTVFDSCIKHGFPAFAHLTTYPTHSLPRSIWANFVAEHQFYSVKNLITWL